MVAQSGGVLKRLEREGVRGQTGQAQEIRDGAERKDELVVRQMLRSGTRSGAHGDNPIRCLDTLDLTSVEAGPGTGGADRRADMPRFQSTRRHPGEHRREEEVVALANQRHFQVEVTRCQLLQPLRAGKPAEAAAEDHEAAAGSDRRGDRHNLRPQPQVRGHERIQTERRDAAVEQVADEAGESGYRLRQRPIWAVAVQKRSERERTSDPPEQPVEQADGERRGVAPRLIAEERAEAGTDQDR